MWIGITAGKPAHSGHQLATLQSVTTLWQGLAKWHPGLQIRPQSDPCQKYTLNPEGPEDGEECAPFGAPAHSHWEGYPQNPEPANQVGVSTLRGWSRAKCLTPWKCLKISCGPCVNRKRLCGRWDNRNGLVCQLHRWPQWRRNDPLHLPLTLFSSCTWALPHTKTGMTCLWFIPAGVTCVSNMWTRRCSTLSQKLKNGII